MRFVSGFRLAGFSLVVAAMAGCGTTSKVTEDFSNALNVTKGWTLGSPFGSSGGTLRNEDFEPPRQDDVVVVTDKITFRMKVTPDVVKLSDTRQLAVVIRLENTSSKFIQLAFPTTQRIEILVRDANGKVVTQWSEDRLFEPTVGYVGINPGEHIEYSTTVSTRDLGVGKQYTVYAFFPNFEELKGEKPIVPQS